jgi:hypothetical protein
MVNACLTGAGLQVAGRVIGYWLLVIGYRLSVIGASG